MNNKETIDQVERGYRMANPVHIVYPESKTHPKEVAQSQSNVYKVRHRIFNPLPLPSELSIFSLDNVGVLESRPFQEANLRVPGTHV